MISRDLLYFVGAAMLIAAVGALQSWNVALQIFNMGLVSAILALGVNMQWGYAGLFNIGIMGFVALGGLAAVIISVPPVGEAWDAGGLRIFVALAVGAALAMACFIAYRQIRQRTIRYLCVTVLALAGLFAYRWLYDPAVEAIEAVNPALQGYLGGLGLPVILSWPVGACLAAGVAWLIAKIALGLRADYLAIATLSIAEIIIAVLKNEVWLTRGAKNVIGLPRPVPYEVDLQKQDIVIRSAETLGIGVIELSSIAVKLCYSFLFLCVLIGIYSLSQLALHSPWGRMMRAIRDDETAAEAMGKDVKKRHLQIFVLGSAVCGLAGAMITTLDGQLTPTAYHPLRFTFLIWVMVIVGGSGNNRGAILGGIVVWFFWIEVEPLGGFLIDQATAWLEEGNRLREHLRDSSAYMRLPTMGIILLLMLRFNPRGLIPER